MPGTNLTRDEAAGRAALLDVVRYEVSLDFTTGPTTFATTSRVRFTARTPGASTWVDFVGDSVEQVVLNGLVLDSGDVLVGRPDHPAGPRGSQRAGGPRPRWVHQQW